MLRWIGALVAVLAASAAVAGALPARPEAAPLDTKTVKILLTLEHPRGLKRFAREVSSPDSKHYRDYRSTRHLIDRFGAEKKTRTRVLSWLRRRGIDGEVGRTRTWVTAEISADQLPGSLFSSEGRARASRGRATTGRIPSPLRGAVSGAATLSDFSQPSGPSPRVTAASSSWPNPPSSVRERTGTPEGCGAGRTAGAPAPYQAFTPNQYTTAYGHAEMHAKGITGQGQRVALVEYDDGFKRADIEAWAQCFGLRPPPIKRHRVGAPGRLPIRGEATLDLEVLTSAAPGLEAVDVYTVAFPSFSEGLLFALPEAFGRRGAEPSVISMSLGICEARQSESLVFNRALNSTFAIAAGAGISTVVASQDTGSATCRVGGPNGTLPVMSASFPATSQFVTAVGGTNFLLDADNRITDQITWNDKPDLVAASGGGNSALFKRPWYQRGLTGGKQQGGKGRAVPDVVGLADTTPGYAVYCGTPTCPWDGWTAIGGTSAATPLLAGGIALANEQAAAVGQAGVGFLNPLLYRIGSGARPERLFDDITVGNNDVGTAIPVAAGGGEPTGCCFAHAGYDRATGWGSVDIPSLSRIARHAAP